MSPNEYTNNLLDSNLLFRQDKKTEIWRWFTYSFCHADAVHLLSNLISQLFLGLFLEIEHKVINWRKYSKQFLVMKRPSWKERIF